MKRSALQNKQFVVLRMAFRAREVLGTFEKRAPELNLLVYKVSLLFKSFNFIEDGLHRHPLTILIVSFLHLRCIAKQ